MKANIQNIINFVSNNDTKNANLAFSNVIKEKVNTVLDIKKIELTSRIFDKISK
jgi:hypothetical protein